MQWRHLKLDTSCKLHCLQLTNMSVFSYTSLIIKKYRRYEIVEERVLSQFCNVHLFNPVTQSARWILSVEMVPSNTVCMRVTDHCTQTEDKWIFDKERLISLSSSPAGLQTSLTFSYINVTTTFTSTSLCLLYTTTFVSHRVARLLQDNDILLFPVYIYDLLYW